MRHNFGLSPFPLTDRRPNSTNRKRVDTAPVIDVDEPTGTSSTPAVESATDDKTGGEQ